MQKRIVYFLSDPNPTERFSQPTHMRMQKTKRKDIVPLLTDTDFWSFPLLELDTGADGLLVGLGVCSFVCLPPPSFHSVAFQMKSK